MRIEHALILALIGLFLILTCQPVLQSSVDLGLPAPGRTDLMECDITQRTCALEVVLVLRDVDLRRATDPAPVITPLHLDGPHARTMLACLPPPAK